MPMTIELSIFDMTGKRIAELADRAFQVGVHTLDWQIDPLTILESPYGLGKVLLFDGDTFKYFQAPSIRPYENLQSAEAKSCNLPHPSPSWQKERPGQYANLFAP